MDTTQGAGKFEFKPVSEPEVDAFTGGPLIGDVVKCSKCLCCYGAESAVALREHNRGLCIGCGAPVDPATGSEK